MTKNIATPAKRKKAYTKLVEALRSGEYTQGKGQLHDPERNTYCCLGVFCDVLIKNKLSKHNLSWSDDNITLNDPDGAYTSSRMILPLEINVEFDFDEDEQEFFITRNDGSEGQEQHSFRQIATLMEKTFLTPKKDTKKKKEK